MTSPSVVFATTGGTNCTGALGKQRHIPLHRCDMVVAVIQLPVDEFHLDGMRSSYLVKVVVVAESMALTMVALL
jgi:hypothetical protein